MQKNYGLNSIKFYKMVGIITPILIFIGYFILYTSSVETEYIYSIEIEERKSIYLVQGAIYAGLFFIFYQMFLRLFLNIAILAKNVDKLGIDKKISDIPIFEPQLTKEENE
ncbi:hypothetical protein [Vagococcus xieshaowenii]|uniref:Uncharacterized protein n=1 Tax=Vagococcus xieshaowenii TaxID=2562451 RepID=A0AAJ5JKU2_9ENTE|nr:hypothetical protein [Vagococcus xieshaowenii]QCA28747.1 hypothetical protein E4Z98_05235 [Vagococcus xieshaowenii]TFZ40445.1 hypothetical protein E4031_06540 [Vagococcus xieshaowenii]